MKKILSVIIAALMIFTALPFAAAADGVYNPFCDLDGDGKIDKSDSRELRKLMASL